MAKIRHIWTKSESEFKTYRCFRCGCLKKWDNTAFRYLYYRHDKITYHAPRCYTMYLSDPTYKNKPL